MMTGHPQDAIIVSKRKYDSSDPYDIILSNIAVLNGQFEEHLTEEEVSQDSLLSYYVDYYLAQLNNGGFSQFVYNSRWNPQIVEFVETGMRELNAHKNLEKFEKACGLVEKLGPDELANFFVSEFFGENATRDALDEFNEELFDVCEEEDLIELNSNWLRNHPKLVVLTVDEIKAEVKRRGEAIPDREARVGEALENEPRFAKLIRALCVAANHEFNQITAGDPTHEFEGQNIMAWHFLTENGHYYLVDHEEKAHMFHGETNELVCTIEASSGEFGFVE